MQGRPVYFHAKPSARSSRTPANSRNPSIQNEQLAPLALPPAVRVAAVARLASELTARRAHLAIRSPQLARAARRKRALTPGGAGGWFFRRRNHHIVLTPNH